ncbi:MAG: NADH:flavin oxidoreductase/NADH oxidase [Thalassobaculaceae bacterium]|nr:NADH:flavin oxidoreductase/NADH oxidase [Thalassobaculaceae bacterium]
MTTETPLLFQPLTLRAISLPNRVVLSPLCMYSARDGVANDWHFAHLTSFARGGTGLVFTEATAVRPEGRITHGCCGLWTDAQAEAYAPIAKFISKAGAVPAVQLAHAGRKASVAEPWTGGKPLGPQSAQTPWQTVGPSALPVGDDWPTPHPLSTSEIADLVDAFAASARRSLIAGFKVAEIHAAHGYLLHSFLSPLTNQRNDAYGGDRAGRMRFLLEVAEAVRAVWPQELPLFCRISAIDGPQEGWSIEDSVALAGELGARGVDVVDCSSGGIAGPPAYRADYSGKPLQRAPRGPGFQVPFAERLRQETGVKTMAVGVITDPHQAEEILAQGRADLIGIGRELMYNPFWALHAAEALGADPDCALWEKQYGWAMVRRSEIAASGGKR